MKIIAIAVAGVCVVGAGVYFSMGPEPVVSTVIQSPEQPKWVASTEYAGAECQVSMKIEDGFRILTANGVPKHKVGVFPNPANPNQLEEQKYVISLPARPVKASYSTHVKTPGYTVAGVPFRPGSDQFYAANKQLGWRYEPMSGALDLGIDESHGAVGSDGAYFYYGAPTRLLDEIGVAADRHSGLVGWAMDGFPIYAYYGYRDGEDAESGIVKLTSSYQLKSGERPTDNQQPGGTYDGTFTADWKYVDGSGDLDNCNGRFTKTPEFPDGTYAYFLTESFPQVPRCLWGKLE